MTYLRTKPHMSVESAISTASVALCGETRIVRAAPQCRARNAEDGSAGGEEVLQEGAALCVQDAAAHVDAMVEPRIAYHVEE
jgi:hypothetical protein